MSLPDQVAIRCDICGWTMHVREDDDADRSRQGYPEPIWPFEWGIVTVRKRRTDGTVLQMDACAACMKKVPDAIKKIDLPPAKPIDDQSENFELVYVGEAAKSILPGEGTVNLSSRLVNDKIDLGRLLVKELARHGYGIFKLPADGSK